MPINFLKKYKVEDEPKSSSFKSLFYPVIFVGIFVLVFSFQVLLSSEDVVTKTPQNNQPKKFSFLNIIGVQEKTQLNGSSDDRINILLLGMGGLGHQGPFLTDTIIIASLRPSTKEVSMLSIPRDLSVPMTGYGWKKINSVNHYGELNNPGNGAEFSSEYFSELFDIPIHYFIRVDFNGFEKVIDELGGIDVYVSNSFSDSQFPDDNYGYQPISFEKGWQKMNGKTALNFARSRHGNNGEGSDFARSQRQQKVLKALKDKMLSFQTLINPRKLSSLYDSYQSMVSTNITPSEAIEFAKLSKDINEDKIQTLVLTPENHGVIYQTTINGAYLLLPRDESFYELQTIAKNIFNPDEYLKPHERSTVEIQNGTKINGLAYTASIELTKKGFDVVKISNAPVQNYEKTVIYDFTNGEKQVALEKLVHEIKANVATDIPQWILDQSNTATPDSKDQNLPDFLILLGLDHTNQTPQ